ncbi:flagellar protein FlbD [Lachnospiraceae bacterium]|nr:flagellar protein FlbD [Lachnospiraceae bacterium]
MIELTKFDETRVLVNEDYILIVEETPDTVITFNNGQKILVKEGRQDILSLINSFRQR